MHRTQAHPQNNYSNVIIEKKIFLGLADMFNAHYSRTRYWFYPKINFGVGGKDYFIVRTGNTLGRTECSNVFAKYLRGDPARKLVYRDFDKSFRLYYCHLKYQSEINLNINISTNDLQCESDSVVMLEISLYIIAYDIRTNSALIR